MPRNYELREQRDAAIKADVAALIQGKMRSEAAYQQVAQKYYLTTRSVSAICYGETEMRRVKDAQKKGQVVGSSSLSV